VHYSVLAAATARLRALRAAPACASLAPQRRVVDYGARRARGAGVDEGPAEAGPPPPPPEDREALPNGRSAHRTAAAAPQVHTRLGAGLMTACAGRSGAVLMLPQANTSVVRGPPVARAACPAERCRRCRAAAARAHSPSAVARLQLSRMRGHP